MLGSVLLFLRTRPSIIYLLIVLLTAIPTLFFPAIPIFFSCILPLLFLSLVYAYLGRYIALVGLVFGFVSGTILMIQSEKNQLHYEVISQKLNHELRVNLIIKESLFPSECVSSFLDAPYLIEADVVGIKNGSDSMWQPCFGSTVLKFSRTCSLSDTYKKLSYGDQLVVNGYFDYPQIPLNPNSFNMRHHLLIRQTPMILYIEEISSYDKVREGGIDGFISSMLSIRNRFLYRSTEDLPELTQRYVAALCFGFKQAISTELKQDYIRTGVIHIFTVSGFHIALFALILLFVFTPLPKMMQYITVISLCGLYVLTTGLQVSAFRAWLMIALYLFLRAIYRRTNNLNTLLLLAAIFLSWRIEWIYDVGFLYSFSATAFLMISWEQITTSLRWQHAHENWIPYRFRKKSRSIFRTIFEYNYRAIGSSFFALLGTLPISCYFMGFFAPVSILLNLIFLPLIFVIFVFSITKMCFGLNCFNYLIDALFTLIHHVNTYCAEHIQAHVVFLRFSAWMAIVMWLVLFLLVSVKIRYKSYIALVILMISGLFLIFNFPSNRGEVKIISGKRGIISIFIYDEPQSLSLMINTIDFQIVNESKNYFFTRGDHKLNYLLFSNSSYESSYASHYLAKSLKIGCIISPTFVDTPLAVKSLQKTHIPIILMKKNEIYHYFENGHFLFETNKDGFLLRLNRANNLKINMRYNAQKEIFRIGETVFNIPSNSCFKIYSFSF